MYVCVCAVVYKRGEGTLRYEGRRIKQKMRGGVVGIERQLRENV